MTDLTGRDLDAAVAACGWRDGLCPDGVSSFCDWPGLPLVLKRLRELGFRYRIVEGRISGVSFAAYCISTGRMVQAAGDELPEAAARALLAVAKAMEASK